MDLKTEETYKQIWLTDPKKRVKHIIIIKYIGNFSSRENWIKWRQEGVLNFHRVLFSLFKGFSMETYSRVYFSLCLFLAISGRLQPRPTRKIPDIRYMEFFSRILCLLISSDANGVSNLKLDHNDLSNKLKLNHLTLSETTLRCSVMFLYFNPTTCTFPSQTDLLDATQSF